MSRKSNLFSTRTLFIQIRVSKEGESWINYNSTVELEFTLMDGIKIDFQSIVSKMVSESVQRMDDFTKQQEKENEENNQNQ